MDIIDTGANLVRVTVLLEGSEKFHVALGGFNRDDISIEALNRGEDVVEVRVAEVRVGLQLVGDTGSGQLEGVDSPLEISIPVSAAERKLEGAC